MDRVYLLNELVKHPYLEGVSIGTELNESTGSYFGIGISGRHELTEELPFDSVGMILTAELLNQRLGLRTTIIIADQHAKTNGFNASDIERTSGKRKKLLEQISTRLGMNFEIITGIETFSDPHYKDIYNGISLGNPYERMQLADMELQRKRGNKLKIGWSRDSMVLDERHFDEMYRRQFGNGVTFAYVEAGRSLDGTPLPPYLNSRNRPRMFLMEDEDVSDKLNQSSRRVRQYFRRIVNLFGAVTNTNTKSDDVEAVRDIYGTIFGRKYS